MTRPAVSVVVPTFRRPELLARCLEALQRQSLPADWYEILVVDDGACSRTRALVEAAREADRPAVRYLPVPRRGGPAAARNLGWQAARAPVIAFTDDDCEPEPAWLAAGLAALAPGVSAVSGRIVVPRAPVPTDYERTIGLLETAEFATANCLVRRHALAHIGGFDEQFTAAWREDSDLQFTLLSGGHRVVRAPECVVVHPVRAARWGVSLREQRKTMFNALLFRKHPVLFRQRIQRGPPWRYCAITGALIAAIVSAVLSAPRALRVSLGAWLWLTGALAARRLAGTSRKASHVLEMIVTSACIPVLSLFWRWYGSIRFRAGFY